MKYTLSFTHMIFTLVCTCVHNGLDKAQVTGLQTDVLSSDTGPQDREKCFNMSDASQHEVHCQPLVCQMLGASWHSSVSTKSVLCVYVV